MISPFSEFGRRITSPGAFGNRNERTARKRAFQGGCGFAGVTGSRRPPFKFFAALGLESLASLVFVHVAGTGGEGLSVPDFRILTQEESVFISTIFFKTF